MRMFEPDPISVIPAASPWVVTRMFIIFAVMLLIYVITRAIQYIIKWWRNRRNASF